METKLWQEKINSKIKKFNFMKNIVFNKISNYKIIGYKKLNCKLKK